MFLPCGILEQIRNVKDILDKQKGGNNVEQVIQDNSTGIKLPKNVRQVGTIDKNAIIYIEDYVVTYLNQMAQKEKLTLGAAALYGRCVFEKEKKYVFISGAVFEEDKPALQSGPSDVMEHGPTKNMLAVFAENKEKYFSELSPVGVAVLHNSGTRVPDDWKQKSKLGQLLGRGAVFIDLPVDGDGAEYFFYKEEGMELQSGHYVYYERNDVMQSFLVEWHENTQSTMCEEPLDYVAGTCRMVMDDKKENRNEEQTVNWVSVSGLLGLIVVSAIGIMVMNHYGETPGTDPAVAITQENPMELNNSPEVDNSALNHSNPAQSGGMTEDGITNETGNALANNSTTSDSDMETVETSSIIQEDVLSEGTAGSSAESTMESQPVDGEQAQINSDDNPSGVQTQEPREYVIEKGDTLFAICRRFYGSVDQVGMICEYNHIEDEDSIFYGQTIYLP